MEIKETHILPDNYGENAKFVLKINDAERLCVYDMTECPEDATLYRDLNFVFEITELLIEAYNAGLSGESLSINKETKEFNKNDE